MSAHPGYAGSVVTQMLALEKLYGADFWPQLARNRPMLMQSIHDPSRTVATGERAVGVNGADYGFLYNERRKGSPTAAVYPRDGIVLIFSREMQQFLAESEGLYAAHPDVTYPSERPKLSDVKVLVVDPDEIDRRGEEMRKRFVELFGA